MSVPYYGDFAEDDTVDIPFNTFTSDDPSASSTITNLINTDIHIHKDGGLTQRNNAAGITVSVDFDGITGNHLVKIDTSDDTVAGFWVTGSEYQVRMEGTTVDGATINAWIGAFSIERAGGVIALLKLIQAAVITNAAGADVAADIIAVKAETALIVADTNELQTDDIPTLIAALPTAVEIQAEMEENGASILDTLRDDLADGGRLDLLVDAIKAKTDLITTDIVSAIPAYMHNPLVDQANIVVAQVGLVRNKPSADPIQIAEITTPGLIKVWRYRKGTDADWTVIVNGGGMGAGVGGVYYQYTFPSASWEDGDLILYEVYGTVVTLGTEVFTLSTVQGFGLIGDTVSVASILADTNELQTDDIPGKIDALNDLSAADVMDTVDALLGGLNDVSAAEVNAEVVDALNVDTYAEPGQEAPGATVSLAKKISYLYKFLRNKITNDGTTIEVYNDAEAVVDQKSAVSEADGTVTRGEFGTGP